MNPYTKDQIRLQNEIAALAGSRAILRDLYLENSSSDLLSAMDLILSRMQVAEAELENVIEARDLQDILPVISLTSKKKIMI